MEELKTQTTEQVMSEGETKTAEEIAADEAKAKADESAEGKDTTQGGEAGKTEGDDLSKQDKVQARIDKLTEEKYQTNAELNKAQAEIAELRKQLESLNGKGKEKTEVTETELLEVITDDEGRFSKDQKRWALTEYNQRSTKKILKEELGQRDQQSEAVKNYNDGLARSTKDFPEVSKVGSPENLRATEILKENGLLLPSGFAINPGALYLAAQQAYNELHPKGGKETILKKKLDKELDKTSLAGGGHKEVSSSESNLDKMREAADKEGMNSPAGKAYLKATLALDKK
jgi:hypothetical protein